MAVERFKKVKDAVADRVGDAKGAVTDKVGVARDAVAAKLAGPEDPYADLPPEQAAAARLADARAARQAELDAKPLRGPAGAFLHGTVDGPVGTATTPAVPPPVLEDGANLRQRLAASREWARQLEQQVQQDRSRFAPPPPIRDLALRQHLADEERRVRDAHRFGYRSPEAWPVVILRFVVPSDDQLGGVARVLAATGLAARPDLVYGVSRVPDRIGGKRIRDEGDGVVEWEVVHASLDRLTPIEALPDIVWFDGTETWVARAAGDPSVLDEDLVLALSASTGLAPEQSLGIARLVTTDVHAGNEAVPTVRAVVRGVALFHRNQTARRGIEDFQGLRWMILPPGPPPGVHVEVLNWRAVAEVVHRDPKELPEIPSRFAYLPSTPQELLTAYLEVVGIWPGDCWSAQTTRDRPGTLLQAGSTSGDGGWDERVRGEPLPCADGVLRRRAHGTTLVVVAYRDRPAYADGRERWAAYQRDVLQADLRLETGAWAPVQDGLHPGVPKAFRGAAKAFDTVEKVANWDDHLTFREGVDFKPHRYCWPPTTGE